MTKWLLLLLLLPALIGPAAAVQPDEILDDPALEERAREISSGLRCLVCQNQSIDDSDAPLARDLRLLVRERLEAGDTDEEIVDFVVARYGEFVLLEPRMGLHTLALWLAAPVLLGIGAIAAWLALRRRGREPGPAPLSDEERRRLDAALGTGSPD